MSASTGLKSVNKSDISSFIQKHSDIIIVSDTEGFVPKAQIEKIMEYSQSPSNGIIFNGDTLDYTYTFGTDAIAKSIMIPENVCALKLLKVFVEGMSRPNPSVICNIGNRDLNKIKLLALLLKADGEQWWNNDNGNSYEEIAKKLLIKFNENQDKENFWLFSDLKTINPFWNVFHSAFTNRWKSSKEIKTSTLADRYDYIFGADPGKGTISAPNNIDFMPMEVGINTNDRELKAAIVFTMYARMLFMKYEPKPGNFQYDGILREYLLKSNAASYAVIDDNLLLFGHGGFTNSFFFEKDSAVKMLKDILEKNKDMFDTVQDITYELQSIQKGGSLNKEVAKIENFNTDFKKLMQSLFLDTNLGQMSSKYIREKENGKKYLSDELSILNILCTPASNHPIFKEHPAFIKYSTDLSPIQVSAPANADFSAMDLTTTIIPGQNSNIKRVYNIFSHIPKGFGYSFGNSGINTHFINTDFSNSLFKDATLLSKYDENMLLLHLMNGSQFILEGKISMNLYPSVNDEKNPEEMSDDDRKIQEQLKIFKKQANQNNATYMDMLDQINDKTNNIPTNISYCPDDLSGEIEIIFNYRFNLQNPPKVSYKNLLYHGDAIINSKIYKIFSLNSQTFKKMIILLPVISMSLRGGAIKLSKKNKKSKKQIHKKRAVRSRIHHRK
jgi:hypothetical protein